MVKLKLNSQENQKFSSIFQNFIEIGKKPTYDWFCM